MSTPAPRLACIAEARVVESVLALAPGCIVVFEATASTEEGVVVQLRDAGGLRAERRLDASPGDCAALTDATRLVAQTLLERNPEAPSRARAETPPDGETKLPPSPLPAVAASTARALRWGALGRAGANVGVLDSWAGTLSAGVVARGTRFDASLEVVGWGRAGALSRLGGEVHVRALGGRLAGCAELVGGAARLWLGVCGRAELGGLHARASGFAGHNARRTVPFLLLSPMLDGHWSGPTGLRVGAEIGPSVALIRDRFRLTSAADPGASEGDRQTAGRVLFASPRWGASFDLFVSKIF